MVPEAYRQKFLSAKGKEKEKGKNKEKKKEEKKGQTKPILSLQEFRNKVFNGWLSSKNVNVYMCISINFRKLVLIKQLKECIYDYNR